MTETLHSAIEAGKRILAQQPALPEGERRSIYAALGPCWESPEALSSLPLFTTVGHRRRVHLALGGVRKVLSLGADQIAWLENEFESMEQDRQRAGSAIPHRSVFWVEEVVASLMAGELAVGDALAYGQRLGRNAEEAGYYNLGLYTSVVFRAAAKAVYVAVRDEDFNQHVSHEYISDRAHPDWDCAYDASLAFSSSEGREKDSARLEQFWTWWLTEAVREAYGSVPEPPVP